MTPKRIIPRAQANQDIDAAIRYCLDQAGQAIALGFVDALEQAYQHIAKHPTSGSSRYARDLDLPGLRVWPLKRYPYLIFYKIDEHSIDVWRILHAERDIPVRMRE